MRGVKLEKRSPPCPELTSVAEVGTTNGARAQARLGAGTSRGQS